MAIYAGPEIVNSNLVLNLDAGNSKSYAGSGTTWTDLSGNGNTATLIASPTYTSGTNSYFTFNGSTQNASMAYSTTIDPTAGITFECWVYPTSITALVYHELYRKENGSARHLFSFQDTGTILSFGTQTTVNGYHELDVNISAGNYVNQWVHLVASYTSGSKVIYRNGVEIGSTAAITGTLVQGSATHYIGSASGSLEFFNGRYAIFRMYGVGLTANQVLNNFEANRGRFGI